MSVDTGIDLLADYSRQFGLGRITGLDIPGEQPGIMPSKEWKRQARGEPWFNGDTINASIGQGFMLATPLQLAVMSARVASRGKVLEPRLVKARNGVETPATEQSKVIDIDSEHWDYMHRAMRDVVHSPRGTANRIRKDIGYNMAGKTGTAQVISISADDEYDRDKINQRQWDHALFIAFAPVEDPQIAIGLIVENGEHGSSTAAPVARLVIDEYMKNQPDQQLGQR
jgi:penicillin-binding protein 2